MATLNTTTPSSPARSGHRTFWTIAAMVGFVLLVSITLLSHQSLRLDESQSLWQTSHSPHEILSIVASDVHVPLYHFLLHYWQMFLGNGVTTARWLSLLFFLATIPAAYFLG